MLSNVAVDWVTRRVMDSYQGVEVPTDLSITHLRFSDQVIVIGEDLTTFQEALEQRVSEYASEINTTKTKLFPTPDSHANRPLQLSGEIKGISNFRHLAPTILSNGQASDDV